MNGYLKLTRAATVGGKTYPANTVLEVDATLARDLLSRGLAVPHGGPGRCLTSDTFVADIKPAARGAA